MRFIIYGAGGIGGVIGAELFKAGNDVALIARGAHLAAIQNEGLKYENPHGADILSIPAYGHPSEITFRDDDVVILTMKSQHTLGALDDLRAAAGHEIPVICCQNGVANERMALRLFQNVYAMLVYLPAHSLEPGVVQTHSAKTIGILDAGRYPGNTDETIEMVTARLEGANFSARPDAQVMRLKYRKLVTNLRNALFALCPNSDEASKIGQAAQAEAIACFTAAGINCASEDEAKARRGDLMENGEIKGLTRTGGSSWQSLMKGSGSIESDYLNGEIVQLGRLHNVPTPVNATLQNLANRFARDKSPAQSMAIDDLIAEINKEKAAF